MRRLSPKGPDRELSVAMLQHPCADGNIPPPFPPLDGKGGGGMLVKNAFNEGKDCCFLKIGLGAGDEVAMEVLGAGQTRLV
jgi:hypothetical protein